MELSPTNSVKEVIARFQPIDLARMDDVKLQNRVDTKYVFPLALLTEVLEELLPHYRLLEVDGVRGSAYRSLYFDTTDLRHYRDHHDRRTFRSKVRFREYVGSGLAYLEVKRKTGTGRTDKKRVRVPEIGEGLTPAQQRFASEASRNHQPLEPTIWNSFTRYTFVNKHAPERLTMDVGLEFSDTRGRKELGGLVVAELKQERLDRYSPFALAMRQRGIRPSGMSKYCVGMLLMGRPVKHNAFKEVLLMIDRMRSRTVQRPNPA